MLLQVPRHVAYLRRWHAWSGNHLATQLQAVATAGVVWPEFRAARRWFRTGSARLLREITSRQVYPDGAQKECSSHVHMVALTHFSHFAWLCRARGISVDPRYWERLTAMWDYAAQILQPSGHPPLNNDAWVLDWRPTLERAATEMGRTDWLYIATAGEHGDPPTGEPSKGYPWSGSVVFRNGYGPRADWAFFDLSPSGTSPTHLHRDFGHLSVTVAGQPYLVDSGAFRHVRDAWRNTYFTAAAGHNVLLVDGRGQRRLPFVRRRPLADFFRAEPTYCAAIGCYRAGYARETVGVAVGSHDPAPGAVHHTRAVVYFPPGTWLVLDYLDTDRPRDVEALWHFHPDCRVDQQGAGVLATTNAGAFAVGPLGGDWVWDIIQGAEAPRIQGWYAPSYGEKYPAPCACARTRIAGPTFWAWVLSSQPTRIGEWSLSSTNDWAEVTQTPPATDPVRRIVVDLPVFKSGRLAGLQVLE
jgi:hypothetical protein